MTSLMTETSTTADDATATQATTNGSAPTSADETTTAPAENAAATTATPESTDEWYATAAGQPGPPEVSPDGAAIAYHQPDAEGTLHLWVSPVDGGEAEELPVPFTLVEDRDPETGRAIRGPQWAPNGEWIAVAGERGPGRTAIWLVPYATPAEEERQRHEEEDREPVVLCDHPASDRSPRWSPDGETIAFVSHRDGHDTIALAPALGGDPATTITFGPGDDREPVWSRDGKMLAFCRRRDDGPDHADIVVYVHETGEVKSLTAEKASAIRHSLDWVPGRNMIAYVTRETDWLTIAVINTDNNAGWVVTREAGDKTDPRFHPDETRLVYVRTEGFSTVLCERGLHASGATTIDPGEGVVSYPRWGADKKVIYGFSAPQRPFGFLIQDNLTNTDRLPIQTGESDAPTGARFRQPSPFEYKVGPEEQFTGLLYRTPHQAGATPAVVYLPDGPLATRQGAFQIEEQALASSGMAVLTPVIHGATGFGAPLEADLAAFADTELEITDIAEAGLALQAQKDILEHRVGIVGAGFGGTLALLTAGARPGIYGAVVAIDPILDWGAELDGADGPWRNWIFRQFGSPVTFLDRYAMRTPATFAALLDVPVALIRTETASPARRAQMAEFTDYLDAAGVEYELIESPRRPLPVTLREVGKFLGEHFREAARAAGESEATTVEGSEDV